MLGSDGRTYTFLLKVQLPTFELLVPLSDRFRSLIGKFCEVFLTHKERPLLGLTLSVLPSQHVTCIYIQFGSLGTQQGVQQTLTEPQTMMFQKASVTCITWHKPCDTGHVTAKVWL